MALAARLAQGRIYYGWYIVAVIFLAFFFTGGMQTSSTAVFLKPMTQDLGISRTTFMTVTIAGTILSGLLAPLIGPLIDRRGTREVLFLGAVASAGATAAQGLVHNVWQLFLVRGLFFSLGMLGLSFIVTNVAVSNWFIRKRGRAMAIAVMGLSSATAAITPLSQFLVTHLGWRPAWGILGLLVLGVLAPMPLLFMKRRPEDLGLLPDGAPAVKPGLSPAAEEVMWTRGEAMRTPALWLLTIAFSLTLAAMSTIFYHAYSFITDRGLSGQVAATAVTLQGLAALLVKPIWGLTAERVPVRYCATVAFLLLSISILVILAIKSPLTAYIALAFFGLGMGGQAPLQELAWANYYGRLSLGAVRSIGMPITLAAGAVGPWMAALVYDMVGDYRDAFLIIYGMCALATVLVFLARPPVKAGVKRR